MPVETARVARTDSGLSSGLRMSVMRLARRLRAERDVSQDLNLNQLSVLGVLERHGPLSVGELAAQERIQPPSMTRIVNCLVERDLVARSASPTDRRQVVVTLTDAGRRIVLEDRRRREAWLAQRLRELPVAERDILRKAAPILERLARS